MPRLVPPDWIEIVAINILLQLYETETGFVLEWEKVRYPFTSLIEQYGKTSCLIEIEHILKKCPPSDLIAWVSDMQKLKNYLQGPLGSTDHSNDLSELRENYEDLQEQLIPYVQRLNNLAYNWNLRASWAGDKLMWRDVQRIQQDVFNAAGVTILNNLSDRQIQILLGDESSLSLDNGPIYASTSSLYLAGGRIGYLSKLNRRLKEFEEKLKASGAKEPPSAIGKHAEWWFDHYVHNMKFSDIADKIAKIDTKGGHYPENIRKAVLKFSGLLGIDPIEKA